MGSLVPVSLVLLVLWCASISGHIPRFMNGRLRGGFVKPPDISHLSKAELQEVLKASPKKKWFNQTLDHFNPKDTRRWRQQYYESGPSDSKILFLMINGEGPMSPFFSTSSMFATYAKKYNAVVLQLEHRYYGNSQPTPNVTTANLRYLSSEQALADTAAFVAAKKREYNAKKVIVFGGSYAGNLAAWFREKYPHLADGAVATSAPVLAQVDFKGYLEVVRDSLATFKPVNSCDIAIAQAVHDFEVKLDSAEGRRELKEIFNLCKDIDIDNKQDVATLMYTLASNFMEAVQYNNILQEPLTIDAVCQIMTNRHYGGELERYAKVAHFVAPICIDFSYKEIIHDLKNVNITGSDRPWTYQTCTEFGYYQSSDSYHQPFGHDFPISYSTQECADIFGPDFNAKFIAESVSRTNRYYGGRHFTGSRVLFVNGDLDPWHYLGITRKIPHNPVIYIHGTAHCANMYLPASTDPPGLIKARKQIEKIIGHWLQ